MENKLIFEKKSQAGIFVLLGVALIAVLLFIVLLVGYGNVFSNKENSEKNSDSSVIYQFGNFSANTQKIDPNVFCYDKCGYYEEVGLDCGYCFSDVEKDYDENPVEKCVINSDCGNPTSELFCKNNDLYNRIKTPKCSGGKCYTNSKEVLVKECAYGCSNGACLPEPTPVECTKDSDCGLPKSELFCEGHGIIEKITTPKCSTRNVCYLDVTKKIKEVCLYGCYNAECLIKPEPPVTGCVKNSDCGEETSELICKNDDVYDKVTSPWCLGGKCSSIINYNLIEECAYGCSNGQCNEQPPQPPISCYRDTDCGINQFIGNPVCSNGHVYQDFKVFSCLRPGTIFSACTSQIDFIMKEYCEYGCSNGACLPESPPVDDEKYLVIDVSYVKNYGKDADMSNSIYVGVNKQLFGVEHVTIPLTADGMPINDGAGVGGSWKNVPGILIRRGVDVNGAYYDIILRGINPSPQKEMIIFDTELINTHVVDSINGIPGLFPDLDDASFGNPYDGSCGINFNKPVDSVCGNDEITYLSFSNNKFNFCSTTCDSVDDMRVYYSLN